MKALLLRDLRLALRAGGGFGLGLAFFLIVTMLVPDSLCTVKLRSSTVVTVSVSPLTFTF